MTTVDLALMNHQLAAVQCRARRLLLSGAWGSGKTRALCAKAVVLVAGHPGNLIGLFRKKLTDLRITTLRTLLKGDGDLPPVLPEGSYEHNKSDRLIHVHGGGEMYYTGFDREERLGSLNLGAALVEEGSEVNRDELEALDGRIRNPQAPYRQLFVVTNPGPRGHVLYKRFLDGVPMVEDEHGVRWRRRDTDTVSIMSSSLDNRFLPADYLKALDSLSPQARKRYRDGEWVTFEGLVYDRFDRDAHVLERGGPWERVLVGVDEGYTNPAVLLPVGLDKENRLHAIDEFHRSQVLQADFIVRAKALAVRYPEAVFIVDPSAAELIASMRSAGLTAKAADNTVFAGIQRVQQRLAVGADGKPGLTVSARATETVKEFEAYAWKEGRDEPVKEFDHALDALRYVIAEVDGGVKVDFWVAGEDEEKPVSPDAISKADLMPVAVGAEKEEQEREQREYLHPDNEDLWS